jgi:NAD-dependent DNA ligase
MGNGIQVQIRASFNQVKFYFLSGGKNGAMHDRNLDPVQLAGTIVKKGFSVQCRPKKLDVRVGDTVFVEKGERLSLKL